ncbi:LCP family glycopolymer transferase [Jeotgalibacillus campisalis]|uniref:Membrane-bound transcriptional regulator LytR n=1 Tax=Jeotgalibacillus campisalis TaxID=220754 RepID=A0A0C2V200_9BACL|nr:LCP family protein [Jeotgalibacillus campisalis]KIL43072.1 membrane-bound transcriptional regulator LytR [Jeotgalibacillus campisalis]
MKWIKEGSWMNWTLGLFAVLILAGTVGLVMVYFSIYSATKDMHVPLEREGSTKREEVVQTEEKDPFSVLILGIDERKEDAGRSDTMIVLTVNPSTESTKLLSIPRDTYVEIAGYGKKDKINHAYAYGGVELAMESVEELLDIPLDYYIKVNMEGFEDVIDVLGGVVVSNPFSFEAGGFRFPEGELILNGKQALSFSRMRQDDPDGDFGRQERQRNIIEAVISEGTTVSTFLNYGDLLESLGENIKTNLTFDQLMDIQNDYRQAADNVDHLQFDEGTNEYIGGVYYYVIPDDDIAAVQKILQSELEL